MECDIPPALSCAYRGLVCWQCVSVAQRSYHGLGFDGKCDRGFGFWGVCDTPQESVFDHRDLGLWGYALGIKLCLSQYAIILVGIIATLE